jgi:hypothetical protein
VTIELLKQKDPRMLKFLQSFISIVNECEEATKLKDQEPFFGSLDAACFTILSHSFEILEAWQKTLNKQPSTDELMNKLYASVMVSIKVIYDYPIHKHAAFKTFYEMNANELHAIERDLLNSLAFKVPKFLELKADMPDQLGPIYRVLLSQIKEAQNLENKGHNTSARVIREFTTPQIQQAIVDYQAEQFMAILRKEQPDPGLAKKLDEICTEICLEGKRRVDHIYALQEKIDTVMRSLDEYSVKVNELTKDAAIFEVEASRKVVDDFTLHVMDYYHKQLESIAINGKEDPILNLKFESQHSDFIQSALQIELSNIVNKQLSQLKAVIQKVTDKANELKSAGLNAEAHAVKDFVIEINKHMEHYAERQFAAIKDEGRIQLEFLDDFRAASSKLFAEKVKSHFRNAPDVSMALIKVVQTIASLALSKPVSSLPLYGSISPQSKAVDREKSSSPLAIL